MRHCRKWTSESVIGIVGYDVPRGVSLEISVISSRRAKVQNVHNTAGRGRSRRRYVGIVGLKNLTE